MHSPSPIAGYPHLTVPMGASEGLPVGLSILGAKWDDHAVLKAGRRGGHVVSLRAPLATPGGADALCRRFGGGGRAGAAGIDIVHRRTEKNLVGLAACGRVDDDRLVQPPAEVMDAAVDLAQTFLAVEIVPVLGAVAIGRSPGDDFDQFRPFDIQQLQQLLLEPRIPGRRHIVLDGCFVRLHTCGCGDGSVLAGHGTGSLAKSAPIRSDRGLAV